MKRLIGICLLVISCNERPKELLIENINPDLRHIEYTWYYKKQPFSGYMVEKEKGRVVYKLPIINGKEHGLALGWYNSGEKLIERKFENGNIEGQMKQWWPNGNYRYLFRFSRNKMNGQQKVYFPNGKIREISEYRNSLKEGKQQVWDSLGTLVSNYTIKGNKIYGIVNVKSCIPAGH